MVLIGLSWSNGHTSGDTNALIGSIETAIQCVKTAPFSICKGMDHFPLSQHLLGVVLLQTGVPSHKLIKAFQCLSLVFWILALLIPMRVFFRNKMRDQGYIYFFVYLSSPLLWYGLSTFNEMAAAFYFIFLMISLLYGSFWSAFLSSLLVVWTKEFAFLYVGFWVLVTFYLRFKKHDHNAKSMFLGSSIGIVFGFCIQIAFNFWRFGAFRNTRLLIPEYMTPTIGLKLNFLSGQWISPNAGWLLFWPGLASLLIWFTFRAIKVKQWFLASSTLVFLVSLTYGFAMWFAPYGWVAWGHRLIVPWLPGLAVFILVESRHVSEVVDFILGKKGVLLVGAIFIFSVPQVLGASMENALNLLFDADAICPVTPNIHENSGYYFSCISHYAWTKGWILFDVIKVVETSKPILSVVTLALIFLLVKSRWKRLRSTGGN
jgi:hypothetical protein